MDHLPLNADPAEIDKFARLAARWWDPDGEFRPLHRLNPVRLTYVRECSGGLAGKQVLDVGCGGGILAESMAREGALVTGLDLGAEPLAVARQHAQENQLAIDYQLVAVEQHAAECPARYDIVTCMEMLEHVPDPQSVVRACAQLVKPGGHVIFSTLNRTVKSWLFAIVGAEYVLKLLPKGTHHIDKFIRPSELLRWTSQAGLSEQSITGLHYNPLLDRFSLGPGVGVNYLLHTRRDA